MACTRLKLTEKSRGRDGPVTARDHDADTRLHEGHREVHDLWPLLVDSERADRHVCPLVHDLEKEVQDCIFALLPLLLVLRKFYLQDL